jgi:nucleotide-binding universal stress UspA family protein
MKRIVVGFDAGEQGRDALRLAEVLRGSGDGELIVAAIDEIEPYFDDVVAWETLRQGYYASVFEAAADALGDEEFSPRGAAGSVPAELDRIAVAERADAIIVGSTHRGKLGRVFPGSVGDRLLDGAPCAVGVAPRGYHQPTHPSIERIGVGYDGQDESRSALDTAVRLAHERGASLRLISVVRAVEQAPGRISQLPGYARALEDYLSDRLGRGAESVSADIEVDTLLLEGDPASELAAQGEGVDLLVVGSRGYGPIRRVLLGGVASSVVRLAPCPVMIIPRSATSEASPPDDEPEADPASA